LARTFNHASLLGVGAALLLAACGSSGTSTSSSSSSSTSSTQAFLATAQQQVAKDYQSTNRQPDSTSRPAAKGKKIVVISAGQAGLSASVPVDAAVEAAKAIGWNVSMYDEQLDPTKAPALMRQAIAAGADGIIVDSNDCPLIKAPLAEAKAKGIKVVAIYSFDCNDPIFGAGGDPLFSALINFGVSDVDAFTESYGANQADAVIAATKGHARVVLFNDLEFTVLHYTAKGFTDELAKCADCKVVDEVDFKAAELGPTLQQKAASALLQHPEANAVKIPYTAATLLGIAGAIGASSNAANLYVMGGEGFAPELDLIRQGKGVSAVNIIASDWVGWASVDSLNSVFDGQQPVDSGIGWALADRTHNLPAAGPYVPGIDFKSAYKKAWGVS
jgi:ribose transport system substrate-binding protein